MFIWLLLVAIPYLIPSLFSQAFSTPSPAAFEAKGSPALEDHWAALHRVRLDELLVGQGGGVSVMRFFFFFSRSWRGETERNEKEKHGDDGTDRCRKFQYSAKKTQSDGIGTFSPAFSGAGHHPPPATCCHGENDDLVRRATSTIIYTYRATGLLIELLLKPEARERIRWENQTKNTRF